MCIVISIDNQEQSERSGEKLNQPGSVHDIQQRSRSRVEHRGQDCYIGLNLFRVGGNQSPQRQDKKCVYFIHKNIISDNDLGLWFIV